MAKQLKKFPKFKRSRGEQYPYDEWLVPDKVWRFVQGEDFPYTTQPPNFKRTLRAAAEARGLHIHAAFNPNDPDQTTLYVEVGEGPNEPKCGCQYRLK